MKNFAALIDLNCLRLGIDMLEDALAKLSEFGKVTYFKFYNYDNKRNREFYKFIASKNAETTVPLRNRKKVSIDIRQVIDGAKISCNDSYEGVFLISAEIDSLPLIQSIKAAGKTVIVGAVAKSTQAAEATDFILLDRGVYSQSNGEEPTQNSYKSYAKDEKGYLLENIKKPEGLAKNVSTNNESFGGDECLSIESLNELTSLREDEKKSHFNEVTEYDAKVSQSYAEKSDTIKPSQIDAQPYFNALKKPIELTLRAEQRRAKESVSDKQIKNIVAKEELQDRVEFNITPKLESVDKNQEKSRDSRLNYQADNRQSTANTVFSGNGQSVNKIMSKEESLKKIEESMRELLASQSENKLDGLKKLKMLLGG